MKLLLKAISFAIAILLLICAPAESQEFADDFFVNEFQFRFIMLPGSDNGCIQLVLDDEEIYCDYMKNARNLVLLQDVHTPIGRVIDFEINRVLIDELSWDISLRDLKDSLQAALENIFKVRNIRCQLIVLSEDYRLTCK